MATDFRRTAASIAATNASPSATIYGWINVGKVKKNRWSAEGDINLNRGVFAAAYVPSDK